jgi:hypothetical protein
MKFKIKDLVDHVLSHKNDGVHYLPYNTVDYVIIGYVESFNFSPSAIKSGIRKKLLEEGYKYVALETGTDMGSIHLWYLDGSIKFLKEEELILVTDKDWLHSYEDIREEVDYIIEMLNKHNPFI